MLDRFVQGSVDRISPEAPVPIFRWGSEKLMLGGVGNVVANLRTLGVQTTLACRVGQDVEGGTVSDLLFESGTKNLALVSVGLPTIQKTRFVAQGHHVLRMDRETIQPLSKSEEAELLARISSALPQVDLVILSDYAKGLFSKSFTEKVITACRAANVPVYIDPKGKDYRKYAGATLVKPNRKELEAVCGVSLDPADSNFLEQVISYARKLLATVNIEHAIVTLSEKGMVYVARDTDETIYLPTECREVSDVSGAGDTTMSVLAAARAVGASFRLSMELANIAAGIVVAKVGTAVVTPAELRTALEEQGVKQSGAHKIFSRKALVAQVRAWQSEGLKAGFTNGCFDCLHMGHLSSLAQAKEHCDKLIVAVNSDASVRRLKGASRPIQNEVTRTHILAGLELVDAVVIFDEETALPVVEVLRPNVIAKEGYTIDNWPEAQFVVSYGGEAVTLKRMQGYSTSSLVARMNEKEL